MKFELNTAKDLDTLTSYLERIKEHVQAGKIYRIEVKRSRSKTSLSLNGLMWLWIRCIAEETGEHPEDIHTALKKRFLGSTRTTVFGLEIERIPSTRKLCQEDFSVYLDEIARYASQELGLELPRPEDDFFPSFSSRYSSGS